MGDAMMPVGARRPVPATPQAVSALPITDQDRLIFVGLEVMPGAVEHPAMSDDLAITMTMSQWAMVMAGLRASMAFAKDPGLLALAHDKMYPQVRGHLDAYQARQHADGHPEGEK